MKNTVLACVVSSALAVWSTLPGSPAGATTSGASPSSTELPLAAPNPTAPNPTAPKPAAPKPAAPNSVLSMLGKSPEELFARFGVPSNGGYGGGLLQLHYPGRGGKEGVFVFHHDVAVQVPAEDFEPARINWPVPGRAHMGQRIETAIHLLGNPAEVSSGTSTAQLRFSDGSVVMVCCGRVLPIPG